MMNIADELVKKYVTPYRRRLPVITGSGIPGTFDEKAVDIPFVFWHQGQYHMLYTGFDGISYQSALAVSSDLIHWTFKGMVTRREEEGQHWYSVGAAGTWIVKESDDLYAVPRLKKIDGRYWMVFNSYPQKGYEEGPAELGMAWSEDENLLDWHFPDKPFLSWKDGAEWERGGLYKSCIIEKDGRWYLFYNAKNEDDCWIEQTGVAVSDDFIHWERLQREPVLRVEAGNWDERFLSEPCIVRDGEYWLNFYFGFDGVHAQEGFAVSKDLIHWEKAEKPILPYGEEGAYDSRHAHKASVIAVNGVLYHFYCGVRPRQEGDIPGIYEECRTIMVASSQRWPDQNQTEEREVV